MTRNCVDENCRLFLTVGFMIIGMFIVFLFVLTFWIDDRIDKLEETYKDKITKKYNESYIWVENIPYNETLNTGRDGLVKVEHNYADNITINWKVCERTTCKELKNILCYECE